MMRKQLAVGLCAMAVSASAATVTWTGAAGDHLWWTDGNWDSGVTPGATSADDIVIPAGDVVYATAGDLNPSGTVTLGSGASFLQQTVGSWPDIHTTLNISGTWNWGSAGQIRYGNGAVINVLEGGSLIHSNMVTSSSTDTPPVINIRGGEALFQSVDGIGNSIEWVEGGSINVTDGGKVTFRGPAAGVNWNLLLEDAVYEGSLPVSSAVNLTIRGSTEVSVSGTYLYDSGDSIEGGMVSIGGEFQWNSNKTISGVDLTCGILACQTAGSVLTLKSGAITTTSAANNGFWQGGGSVDFPLGSTAVINFYGIATNAVYANYVSGGGITYCGETMSEATFAETFTVEETTDAEGGTYATLYLTPVAAGAASWNGYASVSNINNYQASVVGTVATAGEVAANVYLYWGETNGGTDAAAWANRDNLGTATDGAVYGATVAVEEGHVYYFGMAIVDANGLATWAVFDQSVHLAKDHVNTFLGNSTDGADAANWSLGTVPAAGDTIFITSDISTLDLVWPASMTSSVAGWYQPAGTSAREITVTFQTSLEAPLTVTGDIVFEKGRWVHAGPAVEPAYAFAMNVSGNMTVGAEADINAGNAELNIASGMARGYLDAGPGYAARVADEQGLGASHGGEAGVNGVTYGSILNPLSYGSSGHGDNDYYAGGGVISLTVNGTLTLDGDISADGYGYNSTDSCFGASSGGSVNLIAGALAGTGTVSADGGSAADCGSGAGGRIRCKIRSGSWDDSTVTFSAFGGSGYAAAYSTAGAGTVLLQDAADDEKTAGTVVISNAEAVDGELSGGEPYCTVIPAAQNTAERLNHLDFALAATARVRAASSCVLGSIVAEDGASLYLNGKDVKCASLEVAGQVCGSGLYTATDLPELLVGEGTLEVTVMPTILFIH